MSKKDPTQLIVAADVDGLGELQQLIDVLGDAVDWFKVGNQLFTRCGREAVELLKNAGKKVFLDLKYHDIPNTVGQAVRSAASLGADMTNVHASGGPTMLRAAARAAQEEGVLVVAVTVLTSLTADELETVGLQVEPAEQVRRLACLPETAASKALFAPPTKSTPFAPSAVMILCWLYPVFGPPIACATTKNGS